MLLAKYATEMAIVPKIVGTGFKIMVMTPMMHMPTVLTQIGIRTQELHIILQAS
jgi:hypothetical protein